MTKPQPYRIEIPQADVDDLLDRLRKTRWPDEIPGSGWSYGVNRDYLQNLVTYWSQTYDWRKAEARLNAVPQFITEIDGQRCTSCTSVPPSRTPRRYC